MTQSAPDLSTLKPGDHHYQAYVGPPGQYDFMGATQFRLLCTLGLRAHHTLLDVGCGSLRAGRLFIGYLDVGRYCGIEPNPWLIDEAIANQLGNDQIRIKQPRFDHNAIFSTTAFGEKFDYIVAQSIFSHTGLDQTELALANLGAALKSDGILAATFIEGRDHVGNGWVYPDCVTYRPRRVRRFAESAGLFVMRIPWYHPRQTWYLFSQKQERLPARAQLRHLTGAVLHDPEFTESWHWGRSCLAKAKGLARQLLPGKKP